MNEVTLNSFNCSRSCKSGFPGKEIYINDEIQKMQKAFQTIKVVSEIKGINYSTFNYQSQKVITLRERLIVKTTCAVKRTQKFT